MKINLKRVSAAALIVSAIALPLSLSLCRTANAENSATRNLYNSVCGFEFDEASANRALASGGDINWQNPAMGEESILITAIKSQKDSVTIQWMLQHGANPNLRDASGKSALDYAQRSANTSDGRKILLLLHGGASAQAPNNPVDPGGNTAPAQVPTRTPQSAQGGVNPVTNAVNMNVNGGLTAAQVKKTIEDGFRHEYQNHFTGVANKVTFEWLAPIEIGTAQDGARMNVGTMYPVKIQVRLTAEDPRDGNRMTITRGTNADYGFMKKREMYRFFQNGFGEWEYGMYEI